MFDEAAAAAEVQAAKQSLQQVQQELQEAEQHRAQVVSSIAK